MNMEKPMEQHEKIPERNLRTFPAETIEAMAEVEGPGWLQAQLAAKEGRVNASDYAISVQQAVDNLSKGKRTIVYGAGGKDRWFVSPDGVVVFSGLHANSPEHLAKAKELGFEISG